MKSQVDDLVVVTGAAQGFGRSIALRLASDGARLALWDVREAVEETAELCRREGARAQSYLVDISDQVAIEDNARLVLEELGAVFGLVNNAGIFPRGAILEVEPEVWERVLKVNLIGAFLCARAFAPEMVKNGRGSIVNVSSSVALKPIPRCAHYAASKAGLIVFTKSLAIELASAGIRANCVVPGVALTAQPLGDMTLEQLVAMGKGIPLGRIGEPKDIAGAVAFLLGADAAYITGQSIGINGGSLMLP